MAKIKCDSCKYFYVEICIGCGENRLANADDDICECFEPKGEQSGKRKED